MARTVAEVEAEIASKKAAGVHQASREMVALRAELKALETPIAPPALPHLLAQPKVQGEANQPWAVAPPVSITHITASDDVAFVNEALTQLLLKNKTGKVEQAYSDVRSLLHVKHILEDAAGLAPVGRISLPEWSTLGRERDTGEKFKPGENQLVVDGLAQRAVPAPKGAPAVSRPSITTQDGRPIALSRSRVLDEPEGNAAFVNVTESAE